MDFNFYTVPWQNQAACNDYPPELFFPIVGRKDLNRRAKEICNTECPVLAECFDWMLDVENERSVGVLAGMNTKARIELRSYLAQATKEPCQEDQ